MPARGPWLYHVLVHSLAERVLNHIRRQDLLGAGNRAGVAVSGGADSVALLRLLLELRGELGIVVSVVHFNHKLRGAESDTDQEFVAKLARDFDLDCRAESGDAAAHAADQRLSVEAAARNLRYGFFRRLLGESPEAAVKLDVVATAHTLDDQAETVLMRLARGSGFRGLAAIYPRIPVEDAGERVSGEIVRPLLGIRRRELETYLKDLGQSWREDSSNADLKFTRNRVRQQILPLLERELNPALAQGLSELAEIARGEEDYWENEISGWMGTTVHWTKPRWSERGFYASIVDSSLVQIQRHDPDVLRRVREPGPLVMDGSVNRAWFLAEPVAVQRRLVTAIGKYARIPLEFKHVEEVLRFASENGAAGRQLPLPLGWKLIREAETLVFCTPDLRRQERIPRDYEHELPVPGCVSIPEAGVALEAVRIGSGARAEEYNPQQLLRAELLPRRLLVRNWRAGDRFWPAHTKAPRKIKELLQKSHVAQADRRLWPVAVSGEEIVWVRGFPVPARLRAKPEQEAVVIRESALPAGEDPV